MIEVSIANLLIVYYKYLNLILQDFISEKATQCTRPKSGIPKFN